MKTKFLLLVIAVAITGFQFVQAQTTTSLNGKKYKIEIKDGTTETVETLIFLNDNLQTPDRNQHGFKESVAYTKQTDDYITWASTINSEKEGVMAWQGSVKGDKIEGKCTWRKSGQAPSFYTFSGTEVKATK